MDLKVSRHISRGSEKPRADRAGEDERYLADSMTTESP